MSTESKNRRQAKRKAEAESLDLTMPEFAALERRLKEAHEEVIHEEWKADFDERLNEHIKRLEAEDKDRRRQRIARPEHNKACGNKIIVKTRTPEQIEAADLAACNRFANRTGRGVRKHPDGWEIFLNPTHKLNRGMTKTYIKGRSHTKPTLKAVREYLTRTSNL